MGMACCCPPTRSILKPAGWLPAGMLPLSCAAGGATAGGRRRGERRPAGHDPRHCPHRCILPARPSTRLPACLPALRRCWARACQQWRQQQLQFAAAHPAPRPACDSLPPPSLPLTPAPPVPLPVSLPCSGGLRSGWPVHGGARQPHLLSSGWPHAVAPQVGGCTGPYFRLVVWTPQPPLKLSNARPPPLPLPASCTRSLLRTTRRPARRPTHRPHCPPARLSRCCRHLRRLLEELLAIARATQGKADFSLDLSPVGEDFDPLAVV